MSEAAEWPPSRMDSRLRRWLVTGFALSAAARILIAWQLPITDDEAYYWTWSQHLDWGYPDHPPMIAALIRITTAAFGSGPLGIRLGALVLTLATGIVVYGLGKALFSPKVGAVAAVTSQFLPMIAAGGAVAVPDAPLMFFWMLTVWLFWQGRISGKASYWYAAGAAVGLTVMSKLFGGFLVLGLVGFLLAASTERKWLRRPEPYAAAAIALAVLAPFIWWNVIEGWPSLAKISQQIPWIKIGGPFSKTLAYILVQFAYYGPLTAPMLVLALRACVQRPRVGDPRFEVLAWTALPILIVPLVLSPGGIPKPHWPAPAYLLAGIAAAALWWNSHQAKWQRIFAAGLGLNAVIVAAAVVQPWIAPAAMDQARGWEQVTAKVEAVARSLPQRPGVFIFSTGYQSASQLIYRLHSAYPVTTADPNTQVGRMLPLQRFIDWNGVFVDDDREPIEIPIYQMFRVVQQLPPIEVRIDGRVSRRFVVYRGLDFRGLPHRLGSRPL